MKTCNANENTFKSVGTICVMCKRNGKKELLFTPNTGYCVSAGVQKYAVFLPTCECTNGVATPFCEAIQISVCGFDNLSELVAAATQQKAVEVEVPDENGKPDFTLKSITIPAPRTKG